MIVRWLEIDGSDEISVDWRDGAERHRTIYIVQHESDGPYLGHVYGSPLGESDYDTLSTDVARYLVWAACTSGEPPMSTYYAGVLVAPEVAP